MQAATASNNQLLPPEISASSGTWFGRARNYPIFSPAWYRYRSLGVLTGSTLVFLWIAAKVGAGMGESHYLPIDWVDMAKLAGLVAAPFCALCLAGPGLAVRICRLGLPRRREAAAILVALLLGMAGAAVLFAVLVRAYTTPRFDMMKDSLVVRSLPTFRVDVKLWQGAITQFAGLRAGKGLRFASEVTQAEKDVAAAQIAAPGKRFDGAVADVLDQQTAYLAYLGRDALLAIRSMRKLDAGDPAVDPARRPEIERNYAAAIEKKYLVWKNGSTPARDSGQGPASPKKQTAEQAFSEAVQAAKQAAKMGDELGYGIDAIRAGTPLSDALGKFTDAVIGIAALLLAGWLGGLFDLAAFMRQRGKLVEVLQREELKRAQDARNSAELRLSVLTAQVEPHFLFNTLASVRSAISSDPQRAAQIVDHMVTFLRSTIPQMRDDAGSATVSLASQLDSARAYLALMHERIPRLQFSVDAEPGLEQASIPPLMLISLVENAVKHGVEPKIGPARIDVRATRVDAGQAQLEVCVSDDGVGFGDTASGDGIGLANIQERLRSYYGAGASLTLKALPEGGVAAILRLPLSFQS